uniref:DRBM domain-containing protein n=1 Tax=Phaseolus vulgaris TaxID=3885 RepID=V7BKD6_PHAVU|nr:hypothetical protein PHAVU_006G039700g [Phaseolus vulgaris]ESW18422.1 hypothetical protein PHAVU_006G039700g [Phaseolus vulgaris]
MYKTKLQELCHKRKWGLPRYSAMKDGPNHIPRFKASVYVNGVIFTSSSASTSLKEAKNQAAMVAFLGLSSDMDCVHKIQLQNNAPMNNLDPPVFELPPANDFKATELANGCSIECPSSSNTIKETEGAFDLMSLSSDIFDKGDSDSFKTSLMELTEREGFHKPTYKTMQAGSLYMPTFFSTLEVEGVEFHGKGCRSKKEAEEDAANIAYIALKECGLNLNETLLVNAKVSNEEVPKSSFLQSPDEQMMNNRSLSSVNQYPVLPQNHLHFTD